MCAGLPPSMRSGTARAARRCLAILGIGARHLACSLRRRWVQDHRNRARGRQGAAAKQLGAWQYIDSQAQDRPRSCASGRRQSLLAPPPAARRSARFLGAGSRWKMVSRRGRSVGGVAAAAIGGRRSVMGWPRAARSIAGCVALQRAHRRASMNEVFPLERAASYERMMSGKRGSASCHNGC